MKPFHNHSTLDTTSKIAVTIDHATVEFSGGTRRRDRVKAVDDVTLRVKAGERLAFVGQSGCGKTTLLRVIAGLQSPTLGSCHRVAASTSFVFQQPALLPWRRVIDNVLLPLQMQRSGRNSQENRRVPTQREGNRQAAIAALDEVELDGAADRFPHQLSGGMKMRVSIARALVTQPNLLLLDEPFAALDDLLRTQLGALVIDLWRLHQFTMVLVTHNIAEAIALSDRICVIHEGSVRALLENPIAKITKEIGVSGEVDVRRLPEFALFYGQVSDRLRQASLGSTRVS